MRRRIALAMALALCAAAPGAATPAHRGWARLTLSPGFSTGPAYSLAVPPGVVRKPIEGIDSDVAALEGPGLRMFFDYGPYGGLPACAGRPNCTERAARIGGRPARIVLRQGPSDGQPQATSALFAYVRLGGAMSLAVQAYCADAAACARAADIVRTIAFARSPRPSSGHR